MHIARPQPHARRAVWAKHFYPLGTEFPNSWCRARAGKAPDTCDTDLPGTAFPPKHLTIRADFPRMGGSRVCPCSGLMKADTRPPALTGKGRAGCRGDFTWHTGLEDFIQIQGGGSGMGFLWPRWRGGGVLAPFHGLFYGGARVRSAAKQGRVRKEAAKLCSRTLGGKGKCSQNSQWPQRTERLPQPL